MSNTYQLKLNLIGHTIITALFGLAAVFFVAFIFHPYFSNYIIRIYGVNLDRSVSVGLAWLVIIAMLYLVFMGLMILFTARKTKAIVEYKDGKLFIPVFTAWQGIQVHSVDITNIAGFNKPQDGGFIVITKDKKSYSIHTIFTDKQVLEGETSFFKWYENLVSSINKRSDLR